MRRLFISILCFLITTSLFAVEIKVEGMGKASITGYDVAAVRGTQDKAAQKAAGKKGSEKKKDKEINKALEQSGKRRKQDSDLSDSVRVAVVREAQDYALKNALNILLDRVLGAGASKDYNVQNRFEDIFSQANTYIIDQSFSGEVKDSDYVAKASLVIDETAFRELISDMGIALNTQKVRQSAILVVMDEFFAPPSHLTPAVSKETTTYKRDRETNRTKGDIVAATDGEITVAYGTFSDYSNKDKEFYEKVVEYSITEPSAQNLNYTQPALVSAFVSSDIRSIDNDIFKSRFFKGNAITADKLSNSTELNRYVAFAKDEAKADFFAIGVSYITDDGKNPNTGTNVTTGNVFVKIYSTHDGEVIASGSFAEMASGASADQARVNVANKIGRELGDTLSKRIQDYWKKRSMYGSEYTIEIHGSFLPIERIAINKALKETAGVDAVTVRTSDGAKSEYVINYSGSDPVGDAVFMSLAGSKVSAKFEKYDYKASGNNVVFKPIGK